MCVYVAVQLKGFEAAKAFRIIAEPFTVENDLLTPTFKLKRNIAKVHFQRLIDDMYSSPEIGSVAGRTGLRQG